ncbi:MAG: hypothetical protein FWJ70_03300 [Micromonosporaceae bacterium]
MDGPSYVLHGGRSAVGWLYLAYLLAAKQRQAEVRTPHLMEGLAGSLRV